MKTETVFDALKAMGKASSTEIAARLDISRDDAINELWRLKRRGEADNNRHIWWLTDCKENAKRKIADIHDGPLPAVTERQKTETADNAGNTGEKSQVSVVDMVSLVPSFTGKRPPDPVRVTLRMANRELRRARGQVQKWERVCVALRELNRHRDKVALLNQSDAGD